MIFRGCFHESFILVKMRFFVEVISWRGYSKLLSISDCYVFISSSLDDKKNVYKESCIMVTQTLGKSKKYFRSS